MATVSDITTTPLSGLNHIDSLLDIGPDWNFLTGNPANVLYYTFSISSGNENGRTGQEAFTPQQQGATKIAFDYLQKVTGIQFVEIAVGTSAQIHLANLNIAGTDTTGLCSWHSSYLPGVNNSLASYSADAYIYLDNVEWGPSNRDLTPGGVGYQTLLHELGHALGLGHPFHESGEEHHVHLPTNQDNTVNTIMSYTDIGGPYSTFSPYDIAALNWLYGGDGLGGAYGINTGGRYLTGTSGADTLTGSTGDDMFVGMGGTDVINGGLGNDTVQFNGARSAYAFNVNGAGDLVAAYAGGTITMAGIEFVSFTDGRFHRNDVVNDNVAPNAPTLAVSKNAQGYAQKTMELKPIVSGIAEANSLVKVYAGDRIVGEARADAAGVWQVAMERFADGKNYTVRATATDGAGNVSAFSEVDTFHFDTTPPVNPTAKLTFTEGSNQPTFSGTGEASSTLYVVDINALREIGSTTVKADGTWSIELPPIPNGSYTVGVSSVDIAGNSSGSASMQFTVNNPLNANGTVGMDRFTAAAGNAAIDGGQGRDTVVYAGSRADFTIERTVYGVTVTDKTGKFGSDNLINVERIQFNDSMVGLDVDGASGQIYRLYQAAFDRKPEAGGLKHWMWVSDMDKFSLAEIAGFFTQSPEYQELYLKDDPSNEHFVTLLYQHVLHREPEKAGYDHWMWTLNENKLTRAEVLAFFAESPENQAQVIGSIVNGIEYTGTPA